MNLPLLLSLAAWLEREANRACSRVWQVREAAEIVPTSTTAGLNLAILMSSDPVRQCRAKCATHVLAERLLLSHLLTNDALFLKRG